MESPAQSLVGWMDHNSCRQSRRGHQFPRSNCRNNFFLLCSGIDARRWSINSLLRIRKQKHNSWSRAVPHTLSRSNTDAQGGAVGHQPRSPPRFILADSWGQHHHLPLPSLATTILSLTNKLSGCVDIAVDSVHKMFVSEASSAKTGCRWSFTGSVYLAACSGSIIWVVSSRRSTTLSDWVNKLRWLMLWKNS